MKPQYVFLSALVAAAGLANAQNAASPSSPGINKAEIVIGSIQDLSGPLAVFGKQISSGLQMRVAEANELGGVNGRKIRLIVEDDGYDPRKSAAAASKLVNQDGIFAMVGHLGTAQNIAAMPVQFDKNVINFMPISGGREMYEPLHRLKYAFGATYYDQMRIAAPRLMKDRSLKKACIIYQDDDFGLEVLKGAEAGLKTIGMEFAEKTTYKRGATEFSAQMAQLKTANCELVVLGTIIRETVGAVGESRKIGFNPIFVGTNGVYTDLVPKLGGKAMEGIYATMTSQTPYVDSAEQPLRFWATKFKTQFGEDPSVSAVYGYVAMDLFIKAATKAGPSLSTDGFIKTMDNTKFARDAFGTAELVFSPTKRLGSAYTRLSQIQDGRWKVISDYVAFSGLRPVQQKDGKWSVESEFFK